MAYPTLVQLNFKAVDGDFVGAQPIMESSPSQKHPLGVVVQGQDFGSLNYGRGLFIYLKGVASTAAGDVVIYDPVAATTTRCLVASRGPVAVAMSANVANQFGWYQVQGQAVVNGTGSIIALSMVECTATDGQVTLGGANHAYYVLGATAKQALNTPSTGFFQAALNWPMTNGFTATALAPT